MMGALKLIKQYLVMTMVGLTCLLTMLPANAATTTIVVNAAGTATTECTGFLFLQTCNDVYAAFDLYVEGVKVGGTQTTSGSYQNFTFNNVTVPSTGAFNVDVHFINDYSCASSSLLGLSSCSGDRNIGINSVTVGSDTITPAGETIDAGNSYAQATDGITTYAYSVGLYENSALRLSASQPAGPPYDFPNNLPPGCSGSGGTYTCNIDSQMNYDVTFSDTGNVTINHNGDYRLGGGYSVGTASQSANVTINLVDPEGNTNLELYSGSNVYANLNVTTSSGSKDIQISMSGTAAVHGDINASSQDDVYFDMYDNSVVNGDVNTFGTDYASVEIRSNATVNGDVVADSDAVDNGDIVFYDPGVTVTGDVTAHGDITNSGTINGCALITDTYSGARLTLYSGSSTANICKGTVGSCYSSSSYVNNYTGSATPPVCEAEPYDFPNNLPPGCSGSGGVYDCTINSEMDYNVTFSDAGDVTVNHYGRYDLAAGRYAGTATQTANVTINVVSPTSGDTYIDLATGTNVYANFNATTYSSTYSVRATMDGTATIHGNFVADSQKHVYLDMNDDSVLNGDVDASAYIYIFVELFGNATINGDVSAITDDSYSFHSGNVRLKSAGARVNGNVSAAIGGEISNRGTITGCALLADNDSGSEIELISGSTTGSICQGTVGACAASSTYLRNFTSTTPPDCVAPTVLIAEYRLDEASWSGSTGEVLDSSGNGYDGNAINSATTAFSDRAIAGTNGTCAYGVFDGAGKAVVLPTTLPRLKDSVSMTFWVKRLGNPESTYSRLFVDDTGGSYGYGVKLNNDGSLNYFKRGFGITKQNGNGVILTVGEWYFVALTVDDATDSLTFYTYDQSGTLLNTVTHSGYTDTLTSYAPTGQGASIGANRDGTNPFNGEVDELRLYRGALTQTEVDAIRQETHPCSTYVTNVNAAGFNCIAGMESDVAAGHLYTQLVNTAFRVKVIALNDDIPPTAETSFSAASNRTAVLRFKDQVTNSYINFNGGDTANSKNVVFTTANATGIVEVTGISIPQSYKTLGCSVEEVSVSTPSESSDTFSVRPYAFILSSTDANADANGANAFTDPNAVIVAGANFNLTATAVRSATVTDVDVGYNGLPTAHSTMNDANYPKVVQHVGGVKNGVLTGALNQAVSGVAAGNFTYDEVGYFKLNQYAFVDYEFTKDDRLAGDCSYGYANTVDPVTEKVGCYPYSTPSDYFGRFVPERFDVSSGSLVTSAQCNSGNFTYFGQDGLVTQFLIDVRNANGDRTLNYQGDFAKLDLNTWSDTSAATGYRFLSTNLPVGVNLSASATPPVINGGWVEGAATVTVKHLLSRPSTPVGPTTIVLSADPIDADGVKITYANPEKISVDANSQFQYGRLAVNNAYGSELHNLTMPVKAQYWDGTTYRNNTDDSCSNIATANITLGNYQKQLAAGETTLSGGGPLNAGQINLQLSAPGNGNNGSVDLTFDLNVLPWFGITAPTARATFGLYKSPIIYMREIF